jgi:hypothetical protein
MNTTQMKTVSTISSNTVPVFFSWGNSFHHTPEKDTIRLGSDYGIRIPIGTGMKFLEQGTDAYCCIIEDATNTEDQRSNTRFSLTEITIPQGTRYYTIHDDIYDIKQASVSMNLKLDAKASLILPCGTYIQIFEDERRYIRRITRPDFEVELL